MKTDNCSCETTTEVCRTTAGERPRYFPRQLVTAEDLMLEQYYFRNRMRLHNRLLHGWGVVCGLQVAPVPKKDGSGGLEPWMVKVCRGYALGPYGDDIIVPCDKEIPLRQDSVSGISVEPCETVGDVWCADVWLDRSQESRLYLAIKYAEVPTRPMRAQPAGCGCDDTACEFSRLQDGYVIKVLTSAEYRPLALDLTKVPDWRRLFELKLLSPPNEGDPNPVCWPCPEQPWVVLACVHIGSDGKISAIDNCGPRRLVAALGCFYWSCASIELTSIGTLLSPPVTFVCGREGRTQIPLNRELRNTIILTGRGFQEGLMVSFGAGITVDVDPGVSSTTFSVQATVEDDATEGPRDVVVVNPDCSTAFCLGALHVPAIEQIQQEPIVPPVEEHRVVESRRRGRGSSRGRRASPRP
jgi:hypothetical protein